MTTRSATEAGHRKRHHCSHCLRSFGAEEKLQRHKGFGCAKAEQITLMLKQRIKDNEDEMTMKEASFISDSDSDILSPLASSPQDITCISTIVWRLMVILGVFVGCIYMLVQFGFDTLTDDYYGTILIPEEDTLHFAIVVAYFSLRNPSNFKITNMKAHVITSVILLGFMNILNLYSPFFIPVRTDITSTLIGIFISRTNLISESFRVAYLGMHVCVLMDIPCCMMARSQKAKSVACTVILYISLLLIPTMRFPILIMCLYFV